MQVGIRICSIHKVAACVGDQWGAAMHAIGAQLLTTGQNSAAQQHHIISTSELTAAKGHCHLHRRIRITSKNCRQSQIMSTSVSHSQTMRKHTTTSSNLLHARVWHSPSSHMWRNSHREKQGEGPVRSKLPTPAEQPPKIN